MTCYIGVLHNSVYHFTETNKYRPTYTFSDTRLQWAVYDLLYWSPTQLSVSYYRDEQVPTNIHISRHQVTVSCIWLAILESYTTQCIILQRRTSIDRHTHFPTPGYSELYMTCYIGVLHNSVYHITETNKYRPTYTFPDTRLQWAVDDLLYWSPTQLSVSFYRDEQVSTDIHISRHHITVSCRWLATLESYTTQCIILQRRTSTDRHTHFPTPGYSELYMTCYIGVLHNSVYHFTETNKYRPTYTFPDTRLQWAVDDLLYWSPTQLSVSFYRDKQVSTDIHISRHQVTVSCRWLAILETYTTQCIILQRRTSTDRHTHFPTPGYSEL